MIVEGKWTVIELGEGDEKVEAISGSVITMEIVGEQVSGTSGVNRYSGSVLDGSFGPLATTMMAGPPDIMEQEAKFLALLDRCDGARAEGDLLQLSIDGEIVILLQRCQLELTGVVWQLSAYNNGAGGFVSTLITELVTAEFSEDGRVFGSGGCNRYQATYQSDGDALFIDAAMSTRMACPDQKIMEQETHYFALLEMVRTHKFVDYQGRTGLEMYDGEELRILSFTPALAVYAEVGTGLDDRNV
jgi:heat shock protein HslJ